MEDRRVSLRTRVDERASIAIDEHTSLPCLIFDLSRDGVRIVAPELHLVAQTFVLAGDRFRDGVVCEVVWRKGEEIGARFRSEAA